MPLYADLLAYHFDAARFGKLLRSVSPSVVHVIDDVIDVTVDERGSISGLVTATRGTLEADLYSTAPVSADSSSEKSAAAKISRPTRARSFNDSRPRGPHPLRRSGRPGTRDAPVRQSFRPVGGWIWSIPLYDKLSRGYVYSSSFLSDDEAERELAAYCGDAYKDSVVKQSVRFTTGKLPSLWAKNCVAIGLSGGFVEPLESSGLAITQVGIELLASMLDARYFDDRIAQRYDFHLDKFYLDIIHFITAHYRFTNRDDTPYWAAVKNETHVTPELEARLDTFRRHLPTPGPRAPARREPHSATSAGFACCSE